MYIDKVYHQLRMMTNQGYMKRRILPVPLILLVPIVLLVLVSVSGIYRFSLSDEEITAKFPSSKVSTDPILKALFGIATPNPWTIDVPESSAFAFIDALDQESGVASGLYDDGVMRGRVTVDTQKRASLMPAAFVAPMTVSNQGSGVFYYLASFRYDMGRKRMILSDAILIGDGIQVTSLISEGKYVTVGVLKHGENQAFSDTPAVTEQYRFVVSEAYDLTQLN